MLSEVEERGTKVIRRDVQARKHKLSERQRVALGLAMETGGLTIQDLEKRFGGLTRRTLQRDLAVLVEILLADPWEIGLTEAEGFSVGPEASCLRVANPASFMAQKLLILPERRPEKRGKDVLYIHDTLSLFAESLGDLAECWRRVAPGLHPNQVREIVRAASNCFADVTDEARRAAVIAAASGRPEPPPGERIAAACRLGLARVFGA